MRVIGIILARLDSRRLPFKALTEVHGRPLIDYTIERARRIDSLADLVLATTDRPVDDDLEQFGRKRGLPIFRGSTDNVAQRCLACSLDRRADFFVRINGDSPFLDPELVEQGIQLAADLPRPDLVTNLVGRTFPYGIAVEVVSTSSMESVVPGMDSYEAEHVTRRFYKQPGEFRLRHIASPHPHLSDARLVVDTIEDMTQFHEIAATLGPRVALAPYQEVAALYLSHPFRAQQAATQRTL